MRHLLSRVKPVTASLYLGILPKGKEVLEVTVNRYYSRRIIVIRYDDSIAKDGEVRRKLFNLLCPSRKIQTVCSPQLYRRGVSTWMRTENGKH